MLFFFLFVAATLFTVVACGTDDEQETEAENSEENEEGDDGDGEQNSEPDQPVESSTFDPNLDLGGFADGMYQSEAIYPTDSNWTRQSRFQGPDQEPSIVWSEETDAEIDQFAVSDTSLVMSEDGTLYFMSTANEEAYDGLFAVSYDGEFLWQSTDYHEEHETDPGAMARPASEIGEDGNVYTRVSNYLIMVFNGETGDVETSIPVETDVAVDEEPITLGPDSRIYLTNGTEVISTDTEGAEQWAYSDEEEEIFYHGVPIVGSDGTIYANAHETLFAFDADGEIIWESDEIEPSIYQSNMVIDEDDNIYIVHGQYFHAFSGDGEHLWEAEVSDEYIGNEQGLSLSSDGYLIAAFEDGVHAVDLDGDHVWHNDEVSSVFGSTIVDSEGTTYVTSYSNVIAIDKDGELIWEVQFDEQISSPIIGPDQTIYVVDVEGTVHALG